MSKAKLLELFALSCGYCMAMRHAGRKIGDPEMNDAVYGNMEIQRVLLEVHSYRCPAWWHETIN
jgi:hypothetical protein